MSEESQRLIGFVIMNRAHWKIDKVCWTTRYPNQFHNKKEYHNKVAYNKAINIANNIISRKYKDTSKGATYFHTISSNPYWAAKLTYLFTLESHKYYK